MKKLYFLFLCVRAVEQKEKKKKNETASSHFTAHVCWMEPPIYLNVHKYTYSLNLHAQHMLNFTCAVIYYGFTSVQEQQNVTK